MEQKIELKRNNCLVPENCTMCGTEFETDILTFHSETGIVCEGCAQKNGFRMSSELLGQLTKGLFYSDLKETIEQ